MAPRWQLLHYCRHSQGASSSRFDLPQHGQERSLEDLNLEGESESEGQCRGNTGIQCNVATVHRTRYVAEVQPTCQESC